MGLVPLLPRVPVGGAAGHVHGQVSGALGPDPQDQLDLRFAHKMAVAARWGPSHQRRDPWLSLENCSRGRARGEGGVPWLPWPRGQRAGACQTPIFHGPWIQPFCAFLRTGNPGSPPRSQLSEASVPLNSKMFVIRGSHSKTPFLEL